MNKKVATEIVKAGFRTLAKTYHPDTGGTHEAMLVLKDTYEGLIKAVENGNFGPTTGGTSTGRTSGRGQREGDHVALGMIPDDRDPEEKQVGRDGPDGDGHAEYGEPGRGAHSTILPRASSAGHLSPGPTTRNMSAPEEVFGIKEGDDHRARRQAACR